MGEILVGTLRRLLGKALGSGGPGFFFPLEPHRWYRPAGLSIRADDRWKIYRITKPSVPDNIYGLGGHAFVSTAPGAFAGLRCGGDCAWKDVDTLYIYYLAEPHGGTLEITPAKGKPLRLDTRSPTRTTAVARFELVPGVPDLTLKVVSGRVRLFGGAFERSAGGLVLDAIPVLGARSNRWLRNNQEEFQRQLAARPYDLVVLVYGTNESEGDRVASGPYAEALAKLLGSIRRALPGGSVLVVSAPTRGQRTQGKVQTRKIMATLRGLQQQAAQQAGAAFFDLWQAMGGEVGAASWYKQRWLSGDLTHLTRGGGEEAGRLLFKDLKTAWATSQTRGSGGLGAGPVGKGATP
jgi:hypothetical protein